MCFIFLLGADEVPDFQDCHSQLGRDFFVPVKPAEFPAAILRYRNQPAAASIGLDQLSDADFVEHFGHFKPMQGSYDSPLALCYHGHQFGVYNPELGDGRGFLLAQLREKETGRLLDLGTKGSGQTPFSRTADGRLTLKGAVREILATEMLTALGVPTSQTFSVIETGEQLSRNDEPSPARSAVLVRLSHSHIRIGSFQRLVALDKPAALVQLARHTMRHYYPHLDAEAAVPDLLADLLVNLTRSVAEMTAGWMVAGFVHGVLNTDNFNLTGESFDYGPWRFLPELDPAFTAAYFDQQGRYAYGRQPEAAFWALCRLADCFVRQAEEQALRDALADFTPTLEAAMTRRLFWRLGLRQPAAAEASRLASEFLKQAEQSRVGFDGLFFWLYGGWRSHQDMPQAYQPFAELLHGCAPRQPAQPAFFAAEAPVSLTIDEVERVWAAIEPGDDWSELDRKLADIRALGAALAEPQAG
jgi:uncharacterized protein YdiU (UPF0061 family)